MHICSISCAHHCCPSKNAARLTIIVAVTAWQPDGHFYAEALLMTSAICSDCGTLGNRNRLATSVMICKTIMTRLAAARQKAADECCLFCKASSAVCNEQTGLLVWNQYLNLMAGLQVPLCMLHLLPQPFNLTLQIPHLQQMVKRLTRVGLVVSENSKNSMPAIKLGQQALPCLSSIAWPVQHWALCML